jgi:hypothetical protein
MVFFNYSLSSVKDLVELSSVGVVQVTLGYSDTKCYCLWVSGC